MLQAVKLKKLAGLTPGHFPIPYTIRNSLIEWVSCMFIV